MGWSTIIKSGAYLAILFFRWIIETNLDKKARRKELKKEAQDGFKKRDFGAITRAYDNAKRV